MSAIRRTVTEHHSILPRHTEERDGADYSSKNRSKILDSPDPELFTLGAAYARFEMLTASVELMCMHGCSAGAEWTTLLPSSRPRQDGSLSRCLAQQTPAARRPVMRPSRDLPARVSPSLTRQICCEDQAQRPHQDIILKLLCLSMLLLSCYVRYYTEAALSTETLVVTQSGHDADPVIAKMRRAAVLIPLFQDEHGKVSPWVPDTTA
jgi:hypothetical protein